DYSPLFGRIVNNRFKSLPLPIIAIQTTTKSAQPEIIVFVDIELAHVGKTGAGVGIGNMGIMAQLAAHGMVAADTAGLIRYPQIAFLIRYHPPDSLVVTCTIIAQRMVIKSGGGAIEIEKTSASTQPEVAEVVFQK